jgi:hypothetical protein
MRVAVLLLNGSISNVKFELRWRIAFILRTEIVSGARLTEHDRLTILLPALPPLWHQRQMEAQKSLRRPFRARVVSQQLEVATMAL